MTPSHKWPCCAISKSRRPLSSESNLGGDGSPGSRFSGDSLQHDARRRLSATNQWLAMARGSDDPAPYDDLDECAD